MFQAEVNSVIKKYGCKAYVLHNSCRTPVALIFSSVASDKTPSEMRSYGVDANPYYSAICSFSNMNIADGDMVSIGERQFTVVSTVTHEYNGAGLYRKMILLEKGEIA